MRKAALLLLLCILNLGLGLGTASARGKSAEPQAKKTAVKKVTARKKAVAPRPKARVRAKARSKVRAVRVKAHNAPRFVMPRPSMGDRLGLNRVEDALGINSNAALVLDESSSEVLFSKNPEAVLPIASLTKLMTALVVLEAGQDMDEMLTVTEADVDRIKGTSSRLAVGARLTRREMLHIALMSSENRAASALGRHYPGGLRAFVDAMNAHASLLGMADTHYVEPTGLSSRNVSSASDLARLVAAAEAHPLIKEFSTAPDHVVEPGGRALQYWNTNRLVRSSSWDIVLQKTGYISEAGRCLVMKAMIEGRSVIMVFLDSKGKYSRADDANRVRAWLEKVKLPSLTQTAAQNQG